MAELLSIRGTQVFFLVLNCNMYIILNLILTIHNSLCKCYHVTFKSGFSFRLTWSYSSALFGETVLSSGEHNSPVLQVNSAVLQGEQPSINGYITSPCLLMPICWIVGPSVRLYLLFLKRAPIEALVSFKHRWRCFEKSKFLDLPLFDLWMWSLYITDLFPHSPSLWICTLTSSADHFNPV